MFEVGTTPEELKTVEYYNKNAESWVSGHEDANQFAKEVAKFAELLPPTPGTEIVEIGCGGGRDAKLLLAKGYIYTGIDASSKMIEEAKKRVPEAKFLQMNLGRFMYPDNHFDGFWAAMVLLHIKKLEVRKALLNIKDNVKEGGIGFIAIKEGNGETVDSEGRLWAYYQQDEFQQALLDTGFEVVERYKDPVSDKTTFLKYFVKVQKNPNGDYTKKI
jgi:SAM-dependent methyltransferase